MTKEPAYQEFLSLLERLPPEEQEKVLYAAADRCRDRLMIEELKLLKANPDKFVVAMAMVEGMRDWHLEEYDDLERARLARMGLMELHPECRLGVFIIDDAGNRVDDGEKAGK